MNYHEKLNVAKKGYPFEKWRSYVEDGLQQYTDGNCNRAQTIFDDLLTELEAMGEDANESQKVEKVKSAVLSLNSLNEELDGELIETGEREQLCELVNLISKAAGIDPSKYGEGEGLASEWREW